MYKFGLRQVHQLVSNPPPKVIELKLIANILAYPKLHHFLYPKLFLKGMYT